MSEADKRVTRYDDPKLKLAEYGLNLETEEYRDLATSWSALETKAQGSTAVSGVFLAAVLFFMEDRLQSSGVLNIAAISMATLGLIVSVLCALMSLRVRKVPAPIFGRGVQRLLADLLEVQDPQELKERFPRFLNDQANKWREVNSKLRDEINKKAGWLTASQVALVLAVLSVGTAVGGSIWAAFCSMGGAG